MENDENKIQQAPTEEKPLSIVDEASKIRDEIRAEREKLEAANTEKAKLQANEILGGTTGGHVEAPTVTPEEQAKQGAKDFFKGTALEEAIDKL